MQQVAVGSILDGKVTGITKFGAFIQIAEGVTGMVHISEVASTYVKEIREHINENQQVKVKVLSIADDGKISLSIKKAEPVQSREAQNGPREKRNYRDSKKPSKPFSSKAPVYSPPNRQIAENMSFEDMLSKFKQSSDDKMSDLKKYMDVKRGSSNRRRGG